MCSVTFVPYDVSFCNFARLVSPLFISARGDPEGKVIVLNHSYRLTPASRLTLYTQTPVHFAFMKLQFGNLTIHTARIRVTS